MNLVAKRENHSGRDNGDSEDRADEADLVRRCVAGDAAAQTAFYRKFRRQTAANLYRVLGRPDEVDDLLQEVFIIAFRSLPKFRAEARLSTWLYRIAINVALGRIRQRGRRIVEVLAEPGALDAAREKSAQRSPPTPAAEMARMQSRERVYRILGRLSAKKRMVLFLHEIEGRELKEIAYLLDTNPVTVRTRLYYARREFYKLVAADDAMTTSDEREDVEASTSSKGEKR